MSKRTFYDQWHRIAELRVGLRPGVSVRLHRYRSEDWFVYYEAAHCGFFRARPETHALIMEITPLRMLNDIWRSYADKSPKTAPGQQDFFELISALYRANLIYIEGGASETQLLERAVDKKKKPLPARVSELLFLRIPLWDPEPFLKRNIASIRMVYSWPAVLFVALIVAWAGVEYVLNADRALSQSGNILQLGNLIPLYLAIFVTHFLHEMSHAALTKYLGGHVRTMGVMLMMFTPLPYADLTAAWSFRNSWHRAAVGAAGMYADLFVCAVATILWSYSPPGALNEIALNLMFVTAVYTFVFNANPLMRFDGFYILADLIGIPNLHTVAKAQMSSLFRTVFLGAQVNPSDVVSTRRRLFLVGFFIISNIYRIMVMVGIVLFVADQYFGFGLLVAFAMAYSTFVEPLIKAVKPLKSPHFLRKHRRNLSGSFAVIAVIVLGVLFLPVPDYRRLDGVVEAARIARVFVPVNGQLVRAPLASGDHLGMGDVVAVFENAELTLQKQGMLARLQGADARLTQGISKDSSESAAIEEEIATLRESLAVLDQQMQDLTVRAPQDGIWVSKQLTGQTGNWISRGAEIGMVIDDRSYVFQGVLRQETADGLGGVAPQDMSVKIEGARDRTYGVTRLQILPYSRKDLPSVALSPLAGGANAISTEDPETAKAVERFFLLTATIEGGGDAKLDLNGRSGWLQLALPAKPIAQQVLRNLQQFFQRRYKL